jgi:HK97 family phage major capsid protein
MPEPAKQNATKQITKEQAKELFEEIVQRTVEDIKKESQDRYEKLYQELVAMRAEHDKQFPSNGYPRKGVQAARFARSVIAGRGNPDAAIRFAKQTLNDEYVAKALQEADFESGGALIPEQMAAEFIALLREDSTVLALNPNMAPMPGGNLTLRKATAGATAYWVGEGEIITPSQQTTGQVKLSSKTLAVLVPVSNKLLRHSDGVGFDSDMLILDDMMGTTTEELDSTLLRSAGSEGRPKGLLYHVASTHKFAITHAAAAATLDEITTDLATVQRLVEEAKIRTRRPGWIFAPRTKWHLYTIRDGNGNYAFKDEVGRGELFGSPFKSTSLVPRNLGGTSDESEVYFADFARLIVGREGGIRTDTFDGGAYSVSGAVVSGISQDETVMRLMMEIDLQVRYDGNEVGVLTEVDWGA